MKTMSRLCICFVGLLLLSACNDNSSSTPNAVQSNDMTETVNKAVVVSPDDTSPIDIENMTVPALDNAEPKML